MFGLGELRSLTARLYIEKGRQNAHWTNWRSYRLCVWLLSRWRPINTTDTQTYVAEEFPKKFWGLFCILFGFLLQVIGVVWRVL